MAEESDSTLSNAGEQSPLSGPHLEGSEVDLDEFDAATLEDINGIIESETGGTSTDHEAGGSSCGEEDMVAGPVITEVTDDLETGKIKT